MKKVPSVIAIMVLFFSCLQAQERIVKVDFESGSFYNNPRIPFDNPFVVMGEAGKEIEFVKVNIFYEGKITFCIPLYGTESNKTYRSHSVSLCLLF